MGQNAILFFLCDYLRGPGGAFNDQTGPILLSQLSPYPYLFTYDIRKQSDKNFLSSTPKYEKKNFLLHIWGAFTSNPWLPHFQGSKTSSQSRQVQKLIPQFCFTPPPLPPEKNSFSLKKIGNRINVGNSIKREMK